MAHLDDRPGMPAVCAYSINLIIGSSLAACKPRREAENAKEHIES